MDSKNKELKINKDNNENLQNNKEELLKNKKEYFPGAFFSLRSMELINPKDSEKYKEYQYDMIKCQSFALMFSLYCGRYIEVGNFFNKKLNKPIFYSIIAIVPSIIYSLGSSKKINEFVEKKNYQYSDAYYENFIQNKRELK